MSRVLLDTNVFAYAMGGPSPYREPCQEIIEWLATGALEGEVSTDLVQEFLHLRFRRTGDRHAAAAAAKHIAILVALHDVTASELTRSLVLFERHEQLGARDAMFAAIALNVDPLDEPALRALCG
jgi:predicted nucleic acid-binding protein